MAIQPIRIADELAKRPFFRGRNPQNEAQAGQAFARLGKVNNGEIFVGHYQGHTSWERHGQGDEIVQVLDGMTRITLLPDAEPGGPAETLTLEAGMLVVVPQGVWHRFDTPEGVTVMTSTPLPTDHSQADDPRVAVTVTAGD